MKLKTEKQKISTLIKFFNVNFSRIIKPLTTLAKKKRRCKLPILEIKGDLSTDLYCSYVHREHNKKYYEQTHANTFYCLEVDHSLKGTTTIDHRRKQHGKHETKEFHW